MLLERSRDMVENTGKNAVKLRVGCVETFYQIERCVNKLINGTHSKCPRCGREGQKVPFETVESLARHWPEGGQLLAVPFARL